MLITYADGTVFELRVSLVKDLIGITIELLGLGAVLFAGLDYLEGTFLEVSGKHKEVADKISSDVTDTPRFQKMPPWEGAAAELRRLSLFANRLAVSYTTLKRIIGIGFVYILVLDLILEITHLLLYFRLKFTYVSSYSVGNLLFSFDTAIVMFALCNLLLGVHVAVARKETPP